MNYPVFAVTVDLVVLTVRDGALQALLVRRGEPPFLDEWALPGGFVRADEDLQTAARRELAEETGLTEPLLAGSRAAQQGGHLEQLGSYGDPDRDPRGRVVTVAYLALLPDLPAPTAGTDAAAAEWRPVGERGAAPGLAFDHDRILADGVERARSKLEYTPLAAAFCPPEFTIAALRRVYEAVWGEPIDPRNFHRKATSTPGFVASTGGSTGGGPGRPARLYRRGDAAVLNPPILRAAERPR